MYRSLSQYVLTVCCLCSAPTLFAEYFEMGLGGGWRKDTLLHQIYVPTAHDQLNYQESLRLSPIWELRGFLAGMYQHFRLQGDVRYAPFSHGSGNIIDNVFSVPLPNNTAPSQDVFFSDRVSGYALDALATLYYDWSVYRRFHLMPLVGYTYDQVTERRKDVAPTPYALSTDTTLTFTARGPAEKTQVWGPFIGADFKIDVLASFHLQAGYEYQFLGYKTVYFNKELYQQGALESVIHISHYLNTHDAFAHQGHIYLTWEPTSLLRLLLVGEGAYRYANKNNNTEISTFSVFFINPADPSVSASSSAPMKAHWFTLNVDLIASLRF